MTPRHLLIIFGFGLILFAPPTFAQLPGQRPEATVKNPANTKTSAAKGEADRLRKERQSQARSLLISLASEASSFRNQPVRSLALARIANILWDSDVEQGRTLFRRAWEAAQSSDRDSKTPLNLRQQVLTLVARRDRVLVDEFLDKLKTDQKNAESENAGSDPWTLPDASQQRLRLAGSLLRAGDVESALQFADPVLGNATISTVEFLTQLREKNPAAADLRYAAMMANASASAAADANTISLLSSYIFTPHLYVVFNTEGSASWSMPPAYSPPATVDPQLRLAFFQTAAGVLLRPLPAPAERDSEDPGRPGIAGAYLVVKRLLPVFEQAAPREITEGIRGQFEALSALVSDGVRQRENEWTQKGISPDKSQADSERSLLDLIDRAKTSGERDELHFKLALLAVGRDDLKARDHVGDIELGWVRKLAQACVDWALALGAIKNKKIETALELVRKGELTHLQRVWILTQSAKLLQKTDRAKALLLLDDAAVEARRIGGGDLDRPRGLLAVATALELFEPERAWEAIFDAVTAANSAEGFTGEGSLITVSMNAKGLAFKRTDANPDFEVAGIFSVVAKKDYDRAVQVARGFQGEAARANATIAICQSILSGNSQALAAPGPAGTKPAESPTVSF